MTERRPFGPDELAGVDDIRPDELAAETRLARDLEIVAGRSSAVPSAAFADRVMAAVAAEPVPAPARAAGSALRRGAIAAFVLSIRDAFRVTFGGGFPAMVRAQALALVLVVAALGAGTTYGAAAALGLLGGPQPPSVIPSPVLPLRGEDASPSPSPSPSVSPEVSVSPGPAESEAAESESPEASGEPSESEEATASDDGSGDPSPTKRPSSTPKPTATPTDDHGGGDATHSPEPTRTPQPTETPDTDETPTPTPGDH